MASRTKSISLTQAQWQLTLIWFTGAAIIFSILVIQSFFSVYRGQLQQVWSSGSAILVPTSTLIVTTLSAQAIVPQLKITEAALPSVNMNFFRLAQWLCFTYLLLVLVTILAQPLLVYFSGEKMIPASSITGSEGVGPQPSAGSARIAPADVLNVSNLWLAPIQGLVVSTMGAIFFTKKAAGAEGH